MGKLQCLLGIHKYEYLGSQNAREVYGKAFSMTDLTRDVKKCELCGRVKFSGCKISNSIYFNEKLEWIPRLNY